MIEFLTSYGQAILSLLLDAAPFLLLGFFLAGLLKALVPEEKVYKHLGKNNFSSVGLASLFGVPIPLCSCSVIPTATALKKSGASKGATTSFLISTPETGLDSIGITYALLDPIMTVARPLAALVTALFTGSFVNVLVKRGWDDEDEVPGSVEDDLLEASCHHDDGGHQHDHGDGAQACAPDAAGDESSLEETGASSRPRKRRTPVEVFVEALRYAFGPLLDDLTPWFILGFLLSGLITVMVPEGFFEDKIFSGFWVASFAMLMVGTPLYICASATTPVAASLIAKGLDPGAALVLLLVGPATNTTTLLVVSRLLGKKVLGIYLAGVAGFALLFGFILTTLYARLDLDLKDIVSRSHEMGPSWLSVSTAAVLFALIVVSTVRLRLVPLWWSKLMRMCFGSALRTVTVVSLVLLAYLTSCFSVVRAGEAAWVVRFGRVTRHVDAPGLVVHLPYPVETVETLPRRRVHSLSLGILTERDGDPRTARGRNLADEAEMVTGEETIVSVAYTVQYRVSDPYAYRFRIGDADNLVTAVAESALRQTIALKTTTAILVSHRDAVEKEAGELIQRELDGLDSGIEITLVGIQDAHAPAEVHSAFRDVASALEDKARTVRQAEGAYSETLARARAEAYQRIEEAKSYADERVSLATGQATAFLENLEVYRQDPQLTRLRLFFETLERGLGQSKTIFLLGDDVEVQLWNTPTPADAFPEDEEDEESGSKRYLPY